MITDSIFKSLSHMHGKHKMFSNGQVLEPGYKPDFVMRDGNDYIILESENCSSRKTFVGGLIKAAHFLQGNRTGKLIFVIVHKKNTSSKAIANHLIPYFQWIKPHTNLAAAYVIDAMDYYSLGKVLALDCEDFQKKAFQIH